MAEPGDPNSPNPPREPLTVSGGAALLMDRFPEESSSPKKPDPEPVEPADADAELPVDTPEPEEADAERLEDEPDVPVPPPLHKVEVDGVEMEITTKEALEGYSRTADYRKKTRSLADERRKVEAEVHVARQARDAYAEKLTLVEQALADEPTPDWDKIRQETPEDFPTQMADWQLRQEEYRKVKTERKRVMDEQAQEAIERQRVFLDAEAELLQEKIPEFGKPEQVRQFKADLFAYGQSQGFSLDELDNVGDHRAVVVLDKARRYDAIMARKTGTTQQATPTVAPGGRPPSAQGQRAKKAKQEAQDRLARTGRLDDAVEALKHMND